jgi:hypothetical protein
MPNFSARAIWLNPLLYECTVSPPCHRDGVTKQLEHRSGILPAPIISAKHGAMAGIGIAVQLLKFGNHAGTLKIYRGHQFMLSVAYDSGNRSEIACQLII